MLDYSRLAAGGRAAPARAGRSGGVGADRAADAARALGPSSSAGSPTASSLPGPLGRPRPLAGGSGGAGPRPGSRSATGRARCSASTTSPLVPTDAAAAPAVRGPEPGRRASRSSARIRRSSCAGSRSTRPRTSIQFASVPWLRAHLAELLDELIAGASARLDLGSLGQLGRRLLRTDPRAAVREVLRGDLARAARGPRAGARPRPPPGDDVRDRGPRRARHGRRRGAGSSPATRACASASRRGERAAAGSAR